MKNNFENAKRIVVKVGTSTLTHQTGNINIKRFESLVKVLADLKNSGREIILVSSGAMAVGRGKLGLKEKSSDMSVNQATAAVGQGELMHLYDNLFSKYHHIVAQVLMTRDVVDTPQRLALVTNTFEKLLSLGCLPIVNENDTISTEEIEFGDNDNLSAVVSKICKADGLIILTDIDGLYDCDPKTNSSAKLINYVPKITDKILSSASGSGSNRGTGGMITKLEAAKTATDHGIQVCIMNGSNPENIYDLLDGKNIGTHFTPEGS